MEPIQRLGERFRIPLENARVEVEKQSDEFNEMVLYATQFYSVSTTGYRAVWWSLFHAPNAEECFTV